MKTERLRSAPSSRAEFERNLFLLRDRIKNGKFSIMRGISVDGLLRVRALPNGRIDLLSIDEGTRLMANMVADMEGRDAPSEPADASGATIEQPDSESDHS